MPNYATSNRRMGRPRRVLALEVEVELGRPRARGEQEPL